MIPLLSKILDIMSVNDMKKHIIDCLVALIRIENQQRESKIKNDLQGNTEDIKLSIAENNVFIEAVTMSAQQLILDRQDTLTHIILYAFLDNTKDG